MEGQQQRYDPSHSIDEDPPEATFAINEPARDIGHLASWTLTSAKPNHGVEALCSPAPELYWQSDGPSPHKINILFPKRAQIKWISLYMDYSLDESYTPSQIVILAGTGPYDLTEVKTINLNEPRGWQTIDVGEFGRNGVLKAFLVQISILANHQNGKDTHLRGVKVFAPVVVSTSLGSAGPWLNDWDETLYSIR